MVMVIVTVVMAMVTVLRPYPGPTNFFRTRRSNLGNSTDLVQ